jgi:hypothetical protein
MSPVREEQYHGRKEVTSDKKEQTAQQKRETGWIGISSIGLIDLVSDGID